MKVLIIGAGRRGIRIGRHLAAEGSSITYLDRSALECHAAESKVDCLSVCGSGTDVGKLREAGADEADTVIAVTSSDEVNIVSCGIVATEFPNVKNTFAVIRSADYISEGGLPPRIIGISHIINPDQEGSFRLLDTIRYGLYRDTVIFPGTDFMLFTLQEGQGAIVQGESVASLRQRINENFVIAAVYRHGSVLIPKGNTEIHSGDILVFISDSDKAFAELSGSPENIAFSAPNDIMILGATRITRFLLSEFSPRERRNVRVMEKDAEAANELAADFPEVTVINAAITDESVWDDEDIGNASLFLSLTDNDEINIVTSAYARKIGTKRSIALVRSNANYSQFALSLGVDVALSLIDVTVDSLVRYLRGDGIYAMHTLFEGELEVYEYVVQSTFPYIGVALKDARLNDRIVIAGVRRKDGISLVPTGNYVFEEGDSVILSIRHEDAGFLKELFR